MPRYSSGYSSPPRRGYGGRSRSPPRRGYGGSSGRHKERGHGSLLVRNIPLDCRPEELRIPFERFGLVRDVYIPRDYYSGQPRGFAFVEFVDPYDAGEAQYHMNGQIFAGREISVVVAAETRKRPEDMRHKTRLGRGSVGHAGRRSSYHGRSRSRSRSRSPRGPYGSRSRHRSRSYSPAPRRSNHPPSPHRRAADYPRSPRDRVQEREQFRYDRSPSPGYDNVNEENGVKYGKRPQLDSEEAHAEWRASRSPSGSRSRSADLSPRR